MSPKFHVKRGDVVIVNSGAHKGKTGKILEILADKQRARVEGLALVKRHIKKGTDKNTTGTQQDGGIVTREGSIHISNLKLASDKKADKADKAGKAAKPAKD